MNKTIVFFLPNLTGGGAEKVIINLLKTLDKNKFNIKLLLLNNKGVYFDLIPEYAEVLFLDVKKTRYALFSLIKKLKDINPDFVFSTTNRANILLMMATFFINKDIKTFIRETNMPSFRIKYNMNKLSLFLTKILYPRATKVVAQTEQMKEEISSLFKVKKEKIITIHNPIDTDNIDKNLSKDLEIFDKNYENYICVGRLSYQKGYDLLIDELKTIIEKNDKIRLYIFGEGEDKDKLQDQISSLNLEKHIFLKGFNSNPHIYIKNAKALILSSRWEGLPNVVLESLYIGTPVIMTSVNKYCEDIIKKNNLGIVLKNIKDLENALNTNLKISSYQTNQINLSNYLMENND